jgi:hypothetical protein
MPEPTSALADVTLPVNTLRGAAPHLRRPFTAEAVRWKVQTGKLVVPHIDARLAAERLNHVCPHLWSDEYEQVPGGKGLLCRLTVDGITRLDVGSGYDRVIKGLYSDAFKRAAVKFGVGVSLYALPKLFLSTENGHLAADGKTDKGKDRFKLTDKGRTKLAEGYSEWLKKTGEKMFGPALDHGDVEGALGDVEADAEPAGPAQTELPAEPPKLTDATAKALTQTAEDLYAGLSKDQAKGLTKAAFTRALAGAAHSHDELKKLIADLEKRVNG